MLFRIKNICKKNMLFLRGDFKRTDTNNMNNSTAVVRVYIFIYKLYFKKFTNVQVYLEPVYALDTKKIQ